MGAAAGSFAAFANQARRQRLNVLFIAADDMNNRLGCYGDRVVKTPNIDRLAAEGVRFDRAYCQFPLCGPSRASLMTGLRPDTTQVLGNNVDFRDHLPEAVTLPQYFKQQGYFTARDGKMFHMNVPGEVGLPRFQDPPSWSLDFSPQGKEQKSKGERRVRGEGREGQGNAMEWVMTPDASEQADHHAANEAIAIIEKHQDEPFFVGLGFVRPHLPFVAPAKYFDLYPLDQIALPKNVPGDLDDIPAAAKAVRPHLWNHMKMDERGIRESIRGYYASTTYMDEEAGRVLAALEKMKLRERTVVVFWGDHGWNLGEHTRWQKMSLMEDSARVPLIISAPGRKGNGKASRALVEFVDLYPTMVELCGLPAKAGLHGQSLRPLLDDPGREHKKAAFTQLRYEEKGKVITGRSVRTSRYRYIEWEGAAGGGEELYDHDRDAGEFTNLAGEGSHRETVKSMRELLATNGARVR